jgi:hypothetical protein
VSLSWMERANRQNKQTNWFFCQFGAGSIAKEEDGKGWDERMHEWKSDMSDEWVDANC